MSACPVETTRQVLRHAWTAAEHKDRELRSALARAARMVTEICQGRALAPHLQQLQLLAEGLRGPDSETARTLTATLAVDRAAWEQHLFQRKCAAGECFVRHPAPCQAACPAHIDIPSFLALIGHGRHREALEVITADTPLPCSCGLVCPAPCQTACLRGAGSGEPVFIRPMKAVAAEYAVVKLGAYPRPSTAAPSGKRVAVVGSGPAGITAAYYLALKGHAVEIFESRNLPGGMMRYGIPAYRLPAEVVDREIGNLMNLGVAIHTMSTVSGIAGLRERGFDACFLAMGLQLSRRIPLAGIDLPFVLGGVDFLREVRSGFDPRVGPAVVVVGGGNVAVDVALTALRQGATHVAMVCLEARHEMPASANEIYNAVEEGVEIRNSWGPVKITAQHSATFQKCTSVFDEQKRFAPRFAPELQMSMHADHVILAIGQAAELSALTGSAVKIERGLIVTDTARTTSECGVFAGGDVNYGPRTVVEAVLAGKQAAEAIDAYLAGRLVDPLAAESHSRAQVPPLATGAHERSSRQRSEMPERDVWERKGTYQQIELGLTDEMAHAEAARCLRCDLCVGCGVCELTCSEVGAEALRMAETSAGRLVFDDFTRPFNKCVGCGACSQVCPTGAIHVEDKDGVRATVITGTIVQQQPILKCRECCEPYVPSHQWDLLLQRLPLDTAIRGLCPACARKHSARAFAGADWTDDPLGRRLVTAAD